MNHVDLAKCMIKNLGGDTNIQSITHCVTRLRFTLRDEQKVQEEALKELDGVLGISKSAGQFQIIIGPMVNEVYSEVMKQVQPIKMQSDHKEKKSIKSMGKQALDTLISCFVPSIPAIAGSGMIKVLAVLLQYMGLITTESSTYVILNAIGDGIFYFLPFFVAYNAAKKMEVDIFLSMVLAAILLHPDFMTLGETGTYADFFGAPMKIISYSAQALPVIFAVWLLKYADRLADRISPAIVKVFLRPMLSLLIVAPVMLILIGPAAAMLGDWFAVFCNVMNEWGWLAVGLNAALFPIMVLTGTHNATIPLLVQMFATQGFDSVFLPSGLAANIAEAGAAGAVALKTKNKGLRGTALSASFSALLGITEPALYGVNLRLKRPFIGMLLGAMVGGFYIGMIGLTAPTFVTPSVLTTPIFIGNGVNLFLGLSCLPVTFLITFIITYFIGFEDLEEQHDTYICAPVTGKVIGLEHVNDSAFSQKAMGEGFAIIPHSNELLAPFNGEVTMVFPTKHAIGLRRIDGLELLIHVGIDTVNLQGNYFDLSVKQGDFVTKGEKLLSFDLEAIIKEGFDPVTMVVVTNSKDYQKIQLEKHADVLAKERVLYVA